MLVMATAEDLHRMCPELIPVNRTTIFKDKNNHQGLSCSYDALQCVVDSWIEEKMMRDEFKKPRDEIVGLVVAMLECINKATKGKFELMYEEEPTHDYLGSINIKEKSSPVTMETDSPTSVLPEPTIFANKHASMGGSYSPPRQLNLRVQALEKLSPGDIKKLAFHMAPTNSSQQNLKTMFSESSEIEADCQIMIGVPSPPPPKCTASPTMPTPPQPLPTEAPPHPSLPTINVRAAVPPSPTLSPPRSHPPLPLPPGTAPSPPPPMIGKGGPPPPAPMRKGVVGGPPPPPSSAGSQSTTTLKRSTHMGKLYRLLKGKFEGSNCFPGGKSSAGKKNSSNGGNSGGGKSMTDALAEMTKRSPYFQQIEDDVEKHGKAIKELGIALSAFETKDMEELLKFHKHVESLLGVLTDENQVLSRFGSFPVEKLETLRSAAALSTKLSRMVSEMQNWKTVPPLADSLDKVDNYFNKTKAELERLDRIKDEASKRFQSHNIQFDFSAFTKVKESMVDLSSRFMEFALKERREAKAKTSDSMWSKTGGKQMLSAKLLWRTFQFAFRVYSFAGGQDERADTLTRELAKEFETDPVHGKSA